jgi:hypothetical protein
MVSLDYGSKSMFVGDLFALTAIVLPDDATDPSITWDSSDYTVAMVNSSGVVTAKGVGTATISATADGVTDTCEVTVNPDPDIDVDSVNLALASEFSAVMYVGDTLLLEAYISPSDATVQSVTWSSSDSSVASVSASGMVTAKAVGNAKISAEAQGKTDTYNITVSAKEESTPAPTESPSPTPVPTEAVTPTPEVIVKEVVTVVEIDVSTLPEGTKYIKLPSGEIVEIGDKETLQITVTEDELGEDGELEFIALDEEQTALGAVEYDKVEYSMSQAETSAKIPVWKLVFWGVIILLSGIGGTLVTLHLLVKKK